MPDVAAYVTLSLVPGIGRARLSALLAAFESAGSVLTASQEALLRVPGINPACASAIRRADRASGVRLLEKTAKENAVALVPDDPRFPAVLREIPDAPTLLFCTGKIELLGTLSVAIVGSRMHTRYGAEVCRHFAAGAARRGITVISGMARGLDAVAHAAALDVGGGTVGVLGNGLGVIYPSANRELYERVGRDGCLLTEYPPGERPNAGSFARRNRMISGLARATLVVEARARSGALTTADCALSQGREVLAVPGPITSPISTGCNRLIQSGAKAALGLSDLFEELGLTYDESVPSISLGGGLTEPERKMLDLLALGDAHVDDLAVRLSSNPSESLAVLTSLEIRGLVSQAPGKVFRRAGESQFDERGQVSGARGQEQRGRGPGSRKPLTPDT